MLALYLFVTPIVTSPPVHRTALSRVYIDYVSLPAAYRLLPPWAIRILLLPKK